MQQHLAGAEQDGFGFMTVLRLLGRLAQDGVSNAVPEWVSFHSACIGTRIEEDKCGMSPGTDRK